MDFFSSDVKLVISTIFGLIGGAVGGILTAGRITVLGITARERYEAKANIRSILNAYKAQLAYNHDSVYRTDSYPSKYADVEGQDELAESVLRELPAMTPRSRRALRQSLTRLVGALPVTLAENRLHLPAESVDDTEVRQRRVTHMLKAINEDQPDQTKGLLSDLLRTQNEKFKHKEVLSNTLSELNKMLHIVRP